MTQGEGQGMQAAGIWALTPTAEMSQTDFHDWQTLLEERSGMVVSERRRSFLQTNLSARMREVGAPDYASYYRQVTSGPRGAVEWSTLMDRLTVQETRFFRHPASFDLLETYLRQRLEQESIKRPLALWSVGCASGEETYSLAMATAEVLAGREFDGSFGVTGTDISLSALAKSRTAVYSARKLEQVEPALRERYFLSLSDDRFQVIPGLAAREVAVASLATIYALSAADDDAAIQALTPVISDGWSLATALSLLVWFIYAPMCISTLATIKRETNSWKQMGFATFYLFALAYLASLVTYQVAKALGAG